MKNFYLIGLTGNLGSGKSSVRRLLEKRGARGIDADLIAHYAMRRGTAAFRAIIGEFGAAVLQSDGEIDRAKLGARVFADADALRRLEAISHPAVETLLIEILRETDTSVAVVEAVKLIEAGLHKWCDTIWVVDCKPEVQIERVMRSRGTTLEDARARLATQGPLDEKIRLANVVIDNSGDENSTIEQVERAWKVIQIKDARDKSAWLAVPSPKVPPALEIRRARRSDLDALAVAFANRENRAEPLARDETLKRFGALGYRIAVTGNRIVAFVGWEAENLVAIVRDAWAESATAAQTSLPQLFGLIEQEAKELECEVLILTSNSTASDFLQEPMRGCAFESSALDALHSIWRKAIENRAQPADTVWIKRLRKELVNKPV